MSELHDRQGDLLRSLVKPEPPALLSTREFLDGIYERALNRSASRLDAPLREGLTEVRAPDDVAWCELESTSPLPHEIRQLPLRPAPGLLWPRIRADLRAQVQHRRAARRIRFAAIAAVVLLSALLLLQRRPANQSRGVLIKEVSADGPFQTLYSQRSIVKRITRSD